MNRYFILIILLVCSTSLITAQSKLTLNLNDGNADIYVLNDISRIQLVKSVVNIASVSIAKDEIEMKTGETYQVVYNITPENATNKSVTWSSSMNSIATVDANGIVTAISEGSTVITIKTEDGELQDMINVVVSPITSVELSDENIKIYPNPIQSTLFIELGNISKYEIIISDISGNVLYSQYDENKIDLGNYPTGNYFLTLGANNKYYNFKIIKN